MNTPPAHASAAAATARPAQARPQPSRHTPTDATGLPLSARMLRDIGLEPTMQAMHTLRAMPAPAHALWLHR